MKSLPLKIERCTVKEIYMYIFEGSKCMARSQDNGDISGNIHEKRLMVQGEE